MTKAETYEINLGDYIQVLKRRKVSILICAIVLIGISALLTLQTEPEYQSELWIKTNSNFLDSTENLSPEFLEAYLLYPEVIQRSFQTKELTPGRLRGSLSLEQVDDLIRIHFVDILKLNTPENLNHWMATAKLKMIHDRSERLIGELDEHVKTIENSIQLKKQKIEDLQALLAKENVYREIEVAPKNTVEPSIFVYKEMNPYYFELRKEINLLTMSIDQLSTQKAFIMDAYTGFHKLSLMVKDELNTFDTDNQTVFTLLKEAENKYNVYLKDFKGGVTSVTFKPFDVTSAPRRGLEPVSPDLKMNLILAAFLGVLVGIVYVLAGEFFKKLSAKGDMENNVQG